MDQGRLTKDLSSHRREVGKREIDGAKGKIKGKNRMKNIVEHPG